jgi:hypothetical protein
MKPPPTMKKEQHRYPTLLRAQPLPVTALQLKWTTLLDVTGSEKYTSAAKSLFSGNQQMPGTERQTLILCPQYQLSGSTQKY